MGTLGFLRLGRIGSSLLIVIAAALTGCATSEHPPAPASAATADYRYLIGPLVTVIVTNFAGPYTEQIRVIGEATRPQILPYRQNMSVLDVMIAVGGLTDFADGNNARILRTSEGNKIYSVRLRDLVKRGDVTANVDMKPGDVLVIPESWF